MKKFAKITTLFLLLLLTFAAAPLTKAAPHNDEIHALSFRFMTGSHVTRGNAVAAELNSNFDTQAKLTVEDLQGKMFVNTDIDVQQGYNLLKLSVAEIPSGVYFVKLQTEGKTQSLTLVVK